MDPLRPLTITDGLPADEKRRCPIMKENFSASQMAHLHLVPLYIPNTAFAATFNIPLSECDQERNSRRNRLTINGHVAAAIGAGKLVIVPNRHPKEPRDPDQPYRIAVLDAGMTKKRGKATQGTAFAELRNRKFDVPEGEEKLDIRFLFFRYVVSSLTALRAGWCVYGQLSLSKALENGEIPVWRVPGGFVSRGFVDFAAKRLELVLREEDFGEGTFVGEEVVMGGTQAAEEKGKEREEDSGMDEEMADGDGAGMDDGVAELVRRVTELDTNAPVVDGGCAANASSSAQQYPEMPLAVGNFAASASSSVQSGPFMPIFDDSDAAAATDIMQQYPEMPVFPGYDPSAADFNMQPPQFVSGMCDFHAASANGSMYPDGNGSDMTIDPNLLGGNGTGFNAEAAQWAGFLAVESADLPSAGIFPPGQQMVDYDLPEYWRNAEGSGDMFATNNGFQPGDSLIDGWDA